MESKQEQNPPKKNNTKNVTKVYKSIFTKALPCVALSPYFGAFFAGYGLEKLGGASDDDATTAGDQMMLWFTCFPLLPTCTVLTLGVALAGAVVVGLSTVIAYPIAMGVDDYCAHKSP